MKIKILISIILLNFIVCKTYAEEKMKLYALYTPSHKVLVDDFFLPSIQDDFEIILQETNQTCPTARFRSAGWTKTTIQKVDLIIRAIKENWGNIFIFSDVDIQFFGPIKDRILSLIKNNDLIIQKNSPNGVMCSGFFACRANEKTLRLWQDVKKIMSRTELSDQHSLNKCIRRKRRHRNPYGIKWAYLPKEFFGGGTLTGRHWHPGKKLPIPQNILMHHANWTYGIKHKIAQLKYVKNAVRKRRKKSS